MTLKPILAGILCFVASILAFFLAPIAVLFTRWDKAPTADSYGVGSTIRGDLPRWLSWFSTPDERLPGGLYEPTVAKILERYGKTVCAMYWLGVRNRAHGLRLAFAVKATEAQFLTKQTEGLAQLGGGIWRYIKTLGPLKVLCGYRVYRGQHDTFYATPSISIKSA